MSNQIEPSIKVHKEIYKHDAAAPSYTLKLSVYEATGVSSCIFVHEYIPKNPNSGKIKYNFTNVAYYDEMVNVPDYVSDKKHVCLVRKSCLEYCAHSREKLEEFISIVYRDITRLLGQLKAELIGSDCEDVTFTADQYVSTPAECIAPSAVDVTPNALNSVTENKIDAIVVSFDGTSN